MRPTSTCPADPRALTLDVFVADERPDLADLYRAGQLESLRRFPGCLATRPDRLDDACIVLARDAGGRPHGGMRVHLRRPGRPLPIERALGPLCAISEAIERTPAPVVELCGTWIGSELGGSELASAIVRATLAVARALGARRIVGCAHQHVLGFYRRFGAVPDPSLGVHPYPDANYQTRVVWADAATCLHGDPALDACVGSLERNEPLYFLPTQLAA